MINRRRRVQLAGQPSRPEKMQGAHKAESALEATGVIMSGRTRGKLPPKHHHSAGSAAKV
jgi:hypothetical protein